MKTSIVLLCAVVAVLAGCSDLGPYEDAWAVWSDDDSAILVVVHRGRLHSRPYDNARHVEDSTNELWRFVPNTLVGERLRGPIPGGVSRVFYMLSRGYILTFGNVKNGTADYQPYTDVIELDGRRRVRHNGQLALIPSPNTDLAASPRPHCTVEAPADSFCEYSVHFVDTRTLEDVGDSGAVTYAPGYSIPPDTGMFPVWSPTGQFLIREHWLNGPGSFGPTYALRPGEDPIEVPTPACDEFEPATSSSEIAGDGRVVTAEMVGGVPVIAIDPGDGPGYPTHCFP